VRRRLNIFAVAVILAAGGMALRGLPHAHAQENAAAASAATPAAGSAASLSPVEIFGRASGEQSAAQSAAATPAMHAIVVANSLAVRALASSAFPPAAIASSHSGDARAAAGISASLAHIYFTAADQPNRVLALPLGAPAIPAAKSARANLAASVIAGNGVAGSLGDGGAAPSAQLNLNFDSLTERSGVAIAADGTLFIADTANSTIRRVSGPASSEPGIIRSIAGRFAPAENVALDSPLGLALDRAGNLYIADHSAGTVLKLPAAASDTPGALEILAHVISPASIAVTQDGARVYVASPETGSVYAIDTTATNISAVALPLTASGLFASPGAAGARAKLIPAGLAVDRAGNLFVSDAAQNRILRVDAASGRVSLAADHFLSPGEIAFDAAGNLYAADQVRHQIVVIPADGVGCSDAGALSLCPDTFAFTNPNSVPPLPPQPMGGATPPEAFTLTNTSGAQVSGLVWSFTGTNPADFVVSNTSCITTVASGANCTLNVAFNPGQSASPARSASLSVADSNPADSVSSTLSGTADDYEIQIPTGQLQSVSVVAGDAAVFKMQVVPDNTFSAPAYTGAPALTIVCPTNLPAFTSCAISSPNLVTGSTNQITVAAGTPTPFTMTFQTTSTAGTTTPPGKAFALPFPIAPGGNAGGGFASKLAAAARVLHLTPAEILALALILLFAAIFLGWRGLRSHAISPSRARLRRMWAPAMLLLGAAALTGCHHAIAKSTGTPSGTTNFLIQGTVQNASRGFVVQMVVTQ
jgi:hypothetical protein